MMKNSIVCKNCKSENPLSGLICNNCKSYLRERVYNIDLWKTLSQLIEKPTTGFKTIIFSEHKNFVILIILFVSGKFFIDGMFFNIIYHRDNSSFSNVTFNYLVTAILISFLISLFAVIIKAAIRAGIATRFTDNFSIIAYSFLPHTFGFIFLFPIELILFGAYLFSTEPSPFVIKETLAYVMFGFEVLIIIWSIFLTSMAMKTQSNNLLFSFVSALIIHCVLFMAIYFVSVNLFK
jgi:hypothetical protein